MWMGVNAVLALALAVGVTSADEPAQARHAATSPSGLVAIALNLGPQGEPRYTVSSGTTTIVLDSPLGLELAEDEGGLLQKGLAIVDEQRRAIDESYTLPWGKTRNARNHCEELTVVLEESAGAKRRLEIVMRAYDDGVALRYILPKQDTLTTIDLIAEHTGFRFLADQRAWALALPSFKTSNEREFVPVPLKAIKPESIIGPPLTVEIERGPTISIAEGALKDYAGMYLAGAENEWTRFPTLVTRLAPPVSGDGPCVKGTTPFVTPWRVIMIGDRPGALIESTLLDSLNEPSAIADTSWIKPGKAAWNWWSGPVVPKATFKVGMNTETIRHFIDFAGTMNFEYMLIDAGWYGDHRDPKADITQPIPDLDLQELITYARQQNVGILLWLNWENVRDQMDKAFPLYEQWGIKGVKVDYMDRKDQEIVAFYHRVLETAAAHHLIVDFHGAYAGSGEERTWPNLITREGVMGLEYCKWSDRVTPLHDVTLPFTRMLLGSMDFTPGGFRNVTRQAFQPRSLAPLVMGTRAHQLAMYVVYESALQMVSDTPQAYQGQPGADLIREVPTTWDETRVLAGRIGEYVVIARRSGQDWFVGAMTNERPRVLSLPLKFLREGEYQAHIYADAPDSARVPTSLAVLRQIAKADEPLRIEMVGGGGAVVQLTKQADKETNAQARPAQ